jgi:hypothetical protein
MSSGNGGSSMSDAGDGSNAQMTTSRTTPTNLPPNMPGPVNGMVKAYDNANRTFTRPYSAKNVIFYDAHDEYFTASYKYCFNSVVRYNFCFIVKFKQNAGRSSTCYEGAI